jgi:hypothetical protein
MKFYEVADPIPNWRSISRIEANVGNIKAVKINEFRAPKAGEWYISGAIPEAYIAHSDYDPKAKYAIAKLVRTKTIQTTMYLEDV